MFQALCVQHYFLASKPVRSGCSRGLEVGYVDLHGCNKRELHLRGLEKATALRGARFTNDAKSSPATFVGPFSSVLMRDTVLQPVRKAFGGV